MAQPQKAVTLFQTDFPLYTLRMVGDHHILVAGGGGQSRTGIPNVIEIYHILEGRKTCTLNRVIRYDKEDCAIMNSAVFPEGDHYILAAGLEDSCHIYSMNYKVVKPKKEGKVEEGVRKRKGNLTKSAEHDRVTNVITLDIEPVKQIKTDFSSDGGFQKVVQMVNDHTIMFTGGADGYLRAWQYPSLDKLYEVKAHTNEIDDIAVSPDGSKIVTVSRDNHTYVWKTKDSAKETELKWPKKTTAKYRARACRFGRVVDKKDTYRLYLTYIPVTRSSKPDACYISKWDGIKLSPLKMMSTGNEILSSFAVSTDGTFLGSGTISGSVSVHIAFSLQRLYHVVAAHSIFVTGLEFNSTHENSQKATGDHEFTLFSISADNQLKIHQLSSRSLWSPLWIIFGAIFLICITFWSFNQMGISL